MRSKHTFILAAALAGLALGGIHSDAVLAQDGFQLPPAPGETGSVQGPVAEGVPPPRTPPPTPTPSPAETRAVEPESGPPPIVAPIEIPSPSRTEATPLPDTESDRPGEIETEPEGTEGTDTGEADAAEGISGNSPEARAAPYPAQIPLGPGTEDAIGAGDGPAIPLTLIALILLVLGGGGGALWWWRRESTGKEVLIIPTIQRPRPVDRQLHNEAAPAPAPAAVLPAEEEAAEAPANPLRVALEPRQLRLSLVNATLSYRLMLTNSGEVPLTDIVIRGDMISAHSSLPREQQIAGPDQPLEPIQTIDRLAPGESRTVRGEFRLPLPMIRPIRRGDMALFVPLARLSIAARSENGDQPTVITSVVGQIPPRGAQGLQPFRLDLGPRTYSELSQRAFA